MRDGSVRDDLSQEVRECTQCGLVYLSSASHISPRHYEESGMHGGDVPDIDAWLKETQDDDSRRFEFLKEKITNKIVLDFGCGAGGFLERAATSVKDVSGVELEVALQPSYASRGLNVYENLELAKESGNRWDVITAFHVVEHLHEPAQILGALAELLSDGGEIIVEVPNSEDALLTLYQNKAFQNFTYWSQHLYLLNASTMNALVRKAGLQLNWVKHVQRYSLSNHLHWLAKGEPGGHKKWPFLSSSSLDHQYESQLATLGVTDTIIAGISK